jgi:pilus assembly protein Flp/PilA
VKHLARIVASMFTITNEKGVNAIEYGLIAALIAVGIITAVTLIGTTLSTTFNAIATQL